MNFCLFLSTLSNIYDTGRGGFVGGFGNSGGSGRKGPLPTWWYVIFGLISILLVALCSYTCYDCTCNKDSPQYIGGDWSSEYTKCYLCKSKIREATWRDGSHRQRCLEKHQSKVAAMPRPFPLNCPKCSSQLRQWPKRAPEVNSMGKCGTIHDTQRFNLF